MMNQTGAAMRAFQRNSKKSFFALWKHLAAGAVGFGALIGAANCQAQSNFYWAGSASANWADANQWYTTNSAGSFVTGFDWPGDPSNPNDDDNQKDFAWFTNSGTFNVSVASPISGDFLIGSNMFDNASGTVMNVSMNIGSGITYRTGPADSFVVSESSTSTSIVSVTTSGGTLDTGFSSTSLYVGKNGYGVLYLTNTEAISFGGGNWTLGDATNSQGLLIVSGPNTIVNLGTTSGGHLNVGGPDSYGNTVIISNSAFFSIPNFRDGCTGGAGSSNNTVIVDTGALLFIAGGHAVVGSRETNPVGTNSPSINNKLIFSNGGNGDSSNHTFQIGWADNDVDTSPVSSTGNVCIVQSGCSFTNISVAMIRSNNSLFVYGGTFGGGYTNIFGGSTTNQGNLTCWGTLMGSLVGSSNSTTIISNNVGALTISHDLVMTNGSVMQIALGSTFNSITLGSNCTLNGTINFIDGGGFNTVGNHTYTLFTGNFSTNVYGGACPACTTNPIPYYANTNNLTIGTVPNPSATYTISLPDFHTVNLIVGGLSPALPFKITSITRTNSGVDGNNDILIKWNTSGTNNHLLVTSGTANGSYSANGFVNLANFAVSTATTNYVDVGGGTNVPARYYRVSSP
jgi:hypothetical protein